MAPPADPLNFIPADDFFRDDVPTFDIPSKVLAVSGDQHSLQYSADITLEGVNGQPNTHCLIQFATPTIWRIRYNPKFPDAAAYPDSNTFKELVAGLLQERRDTDAWNSEPVHSDHPAGPEWYWDTKFEQPQQGHWILSSEESSRKGVEAKPKTSIHIYDAPFRIEVSKWVEPRPGKELKASEQIIWRTASPAFATKGDHTIDVINNVVLKIGKPSNSQYVGFGEQGGNAVMKQPTFMNYFCFDNYNYNKVYSQGALDPKEPLYHSTPFYLEMNRLPDYRNVTGLMIDNYSQVSIDFGRTNVEEIAVATRFGTFDAWMMAADDAPRLIWDFTSIVGRPKLKPRYVLGHHQGCYGYNSRGDVQAVADGYRRSQIPLDGLHLDVDFQDRYRTFTVNGINFPDVKNMLGGLRDRGIKCCTNITPIITFRNDDSSRYKTLHDFWPNFGTDTKPDPSTLLLVPDERYKKGLIDPSNPTKLVGTRYDRGGDRVVATVGLNDLTGRIQYSDWFGNSSGVYRDDYVFYQADSTNPQVGNYDSGYPFHGGVSYGTNLGTVGFYPDLNRAVARQKWGEQYQSLFDNGLEFVWQDMTTPAVGKCYGDMLGFPSRLMMTDDTYDQNPNVRPPTKTAIELWSLYSYNLHKATYRGLNKLKGRENKRNFIIGRGSQTGMHRYAGLWTGDNASSWDFWRISVAQVLSLGYSGMTIAGVDMGGFTLDPVVVDQHIGPPRWCDPELLIRWYSGAFLLPWYRNHYMKWDSDHIGQFSKEFQEPWAYTQGLEKYGNLVPQNQHWLYASVEPICRHYVQLRYSLIQVLYDTMFENLICGLPIARAMLITDPEDDSLLGSMVTFVDNQYLLGHQILVCPMFDQSPKFRRDIYLPKHDAWYPSNLRVAPADPNIDRLKHATGLMDPVQGGVTLSYDCRIPDAGNQSEQVSYVTPVYLRAGSIIPQVDVRQCVDNNLNPPCIHVLPGFKETGYSMFLDDGISRDSAPQHLPQYKNAHNPAPENEAKSKYREVRIEQSFINAGPYTRTITLAHLWDGYDPTPQIGDSYVLGIWTAKSRSPANASLIQWDFQDANGKSIQDSGLSFQYDVLRGACIVVIPMRLVPLSTNNAKKFLAIRLASFN